jgi:hypothetical protein
VFLTWRTPYGKYEGKFSTENKEEEYLDFDIENTTFARFNDGVDSLFASTVKVTWKFGMFDETALIEKGDEVFPRDEMILHAVGFPWSGGARGI